MAAGVETVGRNIPDMCGQIADLSVVVRASLTAPARVGRSAAASWVDLSSRWIRAEGEANRA
jgi:hypothetical protein